MKVHELIEQLSKHPQDAEVILSSDPEGNSYDTVYEVDAAYYDPEGQEIWPVHEDEIEEDEYENLTVGVFIWP
jgi:hypothetical protein